MGWAWTKKKMIRCEWWSELWWILDHPGLFI